MCNGNVLDMKARWISILNHIRNRSSVLKALEKQVTDARLLRTFPYYVTCETTSELESFNNHLTMYAPKRNAFSYPVYKCRCQLAAIDYSKHLKRTQVVDKDGNARWKRAYSKAANNWTVKPVKEAKAYGYIPRLQQQIAERYIGGQGSLRATVQVSEQDPRRISTNIAPVSPEATSTIAKSLQPRITKKTH